MCLIVYQPAGTPQLDKAVFRNAWRTNKDGAGYMFAVDGKLIIRKPFWGVKKLWKSYRKDHAAYGTLSDFVIHFRYSTHGKIDGVNTHPHSLDDGNAALVHNGMLWEFEGTDGAISDTVNFCRTVLAYRPAAQLTSGKFSLFLEPLIGSTNKIVIMDSTGRVQIINESFGVWDGSIWYSNDGYKEPAYRPVPKWSRDMSLFTPPGFTDAEIEAMEDGSFETVRDEFDWMEEEQWRDCVAAMERDRCPA